MRQSPNWKPIDKKHPEAPRLAVFGRGLNVYFRVGFEIADMPAQCRGHGDTQDIIYAIHLAPGENRGTAIVTVGVR